MRISLESFLCEIRRRFFYDFELLFGFGKSLAKSLKLLLLLQGSGKSLTTGLSSLGGSYPGSQQTAADLQFTGRLGHIFPLLGQSHGPLLELPIKCTSFLV